MKHRRKYPRHCCKRCDRMHHTYAAAEKHKRSMMGGKRSAPKRRRAKTGFAAMSMKKRRAIARKGGRASARSRGYR